MNRNKFLGLVGLVGAAFVGGAIMPTLIRTGVSSIHPFLFNWLRSLLGLIISLIIFKKHYSFKKLINKKNFPLITAIGLGLGLNILLYSIAIPHTTLIASQLIYVLVPVISSILAFFVIKEKINFQKIIGIVLSILGVTLLIVSSTSPDQRASLGTFYGNFLIFIGVIGFSSYLTFSKKYNFKKSVIEMTILSSLSLSLFFSPFALYELIFGKGFSTVDIKSSLATIFIAIAALIFTSLSQLSLKHLSTSTASLSLILNPEFAALTGIVIYHETLSPVLLLSLVMAITGVIISTNSKQQSFADKIKQLPQQILSKIIK
jgi:drug/metabolite transporter (DMT)-like permease